MDRIVEIKTSSKYSTFKDYIKRKFEEGYSWEEIKYATQGSEQRLIAWLNLVNDTQDLDLKLSEWYILWEHIRELYDNLLSGWLGEPNKPLKEAPRDSFSCWQHYKKKLIESKYSTDSIQNIELSTVKLISQLEEQTEMTNPVRGVVFGNVQSGKTANMAALISMAADYGYNFFIVLSGTIENLRIQTSKRLTQDLNFSGTSKVFVTIDRLLAVNTSPNRLQDLQLNDNSKVVYLNVCLKNSTRLSGLLRWINKDKSAKSKLKILLIDDEADQAGINTANISKDLETRISKLIKNIVFAKDVKGKENGSYCCMNYIGYTATPYANFLNEATDKSLYPKNFILSLKPANEYIGPLQYFGIEDKMQSLPIVNIIDEDDVISINRNLINENFKIPESLKKSIYWFICTVAIARTWKLKRSVSMLVHLSQRVEKHSYIANSILKFISMLSKDNDFMEKIKIVFDEEIRKLSVDDFRAILTKYNENIEIKSYPSFASIENEINKLVKLGINYIQFDNETQSFEYGEGLHLCVDNCAIKPSEENISMRIVYPESGDKILEKTPAFIVIGGNTLSRGLTLEGLTTSYFLRTTKMADTLMQMGRWFGYRIGYELLPRLWLSNSSIEQFTKLTLLDCELRNELEKMNILNYSPSEYGPRVLNFPGYKLLKITDKKKMQNAIVDFSDLNKSGQIIKFYKDDEIIENNYNLTTNFIESLGKVNKDEIAKLSNKYVNDIKEPLIWFNVNSDKVFDLLQGLNFPSKQKAIITEIDKLRDWYNEEKLNKCIGDWNVIVGQLKSPKKTVKLKNCNIHLVTRTKKIEQNTNDDIINIGVLTNQYDKILDIDETKLTKQEKEFFENLDADKEDSFNRIENIRLRFDKDKKPILLLYFIDKDSGKGNKEILQIKEIKRLPLEVTQHLVGYYIYIPDVRDKNHKGTNSVTVNLEFISEELGDYNKGEEVIDNEDDVQAA